MRRPLFIFLGLAIVLAIAGAVLKPKFGQAVRPMGQTYRQDRGYFYRFRADFEVRETGEQLAFDYIVACDIRLTRWRGGGLSDDSSYSPRVIFKGTSNGHVVMLRTLEACHGLMSEYDDIPPDVLPLAIWFEDPQNLSVGVGYVSEDAYESPLSKLTFRGARVDRSTREEWEAWRKKSADTYVQVGEIPGPWGYDFPVPRGDLASDRGKYATECHGYMRLKLPEDMRPKLHALWPAEHSRFWTLPSSDERLKFGAVVNDAKQPFPPGVSGWLHRFGSPGDSRSSGLPIRSGRVVGSSLKADGSRRKHVPSRWPAENYPFLSLPLKSVAPLTIAGFPPQDSYERNLEFRNGALNGFAACQNILDANGHRMRENDPLWREKRQVFEVDGAFVKELDKSTPELTVPQYVAERDEAVFFAFNIIF